MAKEQLELMAQTTIPVVALDYYHQITDRSDRKHPTKSIPRADTIDSQTRLFALESELSQKLFLSINYLDKAGKDMVILAHAMALFAHKGHYRDNGLPYSEHPLSTTEEMARVDQPDAITLAASLLHDATEDTSMQSAEIKERLGEEVARTVDDLSKYRGRFLRKTVIDEKSRLKVIGALIYNPRVAAIKIRERLHNMRDLAGKKGRAKRLAIIAETQQVYVPLAERLGKFEVASELDELCMQQQGPEYKQLAAVIAERRDQIFTDERRKILVREIADSVGLPSDQIAVKKPGIHEIYRHIGEMRPITDEDFYAEVDIVMRDVFKISHQNNRPKWYTTALKLYDDFISSPEYELVVEVDEKQLLQDIEKDFADSLSFQLKRKKDNLIVNVHIFPQDAYLEEYFIPLTDLYYHRPSLSSDSSPEAIEMDDIRVRHMNAEMKFENLKKRYARLANLVERGEISASQILRQLEARLSVGHMRVIGIDDKGEEQLRIVKKGSSVMDYARDLFQASWPRILQATVNGQPVSLGHILIEGEKLHLDFHPNVNQWDPAWIHYFQTDQEGPQEVRLGVERILTGDSEKKKDKMKARILEIGKWRIEQELDPDNRPLRISLGRAMDIVRSKFPQATEEKFYEMVALGEVESGLIKNVASRLSKPNREVGILSVVFERNRSGQGGALLSHAARIGINLLDIDVGAYGEGPSVITLYLDPDDHRSAEELLEEIRKSGACRRLGMKSIRFVTPRGGKFINVD